MRQETSCCADRSDIGRLALQYMLRNFGPGNGRGAWQRLAVRARLAVCRTIIGCTDYVAPYRVKLERSAFNVF